jgi:hypothetical protein
MMTELTLVETGGRSVALWAGLRGLDKGTLPGRSEFYACNREGGTSRTLTDSGVALEGPVFV